MKSKIFITLLLLCTGPKLFAQKTNSGIILSIENAKIYIDIASSSVHVNDIFNVYSGGGYFIHPITKKRIKKDKELVGKLEITSVHSDYSEAVAVPSQSIRQMGTGMKVEKDIKTENNSTISLNDNNRISVIVAPAQVNDVVNNGYFGGYVADILMEQLITNNKIKLLDRSVLNAQLDESNLQGNYIDPTTAIERGKISGAQYIIQITMQKPDVVNINTGVPLASIMGALQTVTGKNIGAQYMSNTKVSTLKASVIITARIVDLQTGEVVFMCSGKGNAKGNSQVSMESGALGGAQVNGGAEGFKQTVTGQAVQKAFYVIGRELNDHFNGKTTSKIVGSTSGYGYNGQKLTLRNNHIYNGIDRLSDDDLKMTFSNQPNLYFQYKKTKKIRPLTCYLTSTLIFSGSVIGGVLLYNNNMGSYTPYIVGSGVLIFIAGITSGLIIHHNIHKKMQNIIDSYNSSLSPSYTSSKRTNMDLGLVATGNGLGLRLTF